MCLCAAIIGPDLGSVTHTVSLFYIFHLCLCTAIWGWRPLFSRKWVRRLQVRMTNLEGLIRAFVRYAHLCYSRTTGLEDSKVYFSSILFETQFWPLFMPQMTNSWVSVSCERLLNGLSFNMLVAVIWLNLGSEGSYRMSLVDIFRLPQCPVGQNLGLSQCSQQIFQDCQRCKCKSWRLVIVL